MKKYFKLIVVVIILGTRFLGIQGVDNRRIVLAKPQLYLNAYPPPGPSSASNYEVADDFSRPKVRRGKIRFIRNKRENNGGWGGLGSRLLNSISPGNLLGSGTNNDERYEEDSYASATGYGHGGGGGHGGYGGGGYGHGGGGGYGKGQLNNSAVGLLGFLSLLSLIQTVLNQTTTTAAPMGKRTKRDFTGERVEKGDIREVAPTQADKIIQLLLPVLSAIAHARDELIPIECTLRQVCIANQILVKELGVSGRSVGTMLSDGIGRILKEVDKKGDAVTAVKKAGKAGRMGKKCQKIYEECPAITHLPHYYIPASMTF